MRESKICLVCSRNFIPSTNTAGKYCSGKCYQSVPKKRTDLASRFWKYVEKSEDGCWLWMGARSENQGRNQYGRLKIPTGLRLVQVKISAHRLSWNLHFGAIPEGMQVCHKCDNPPCVRPDHLFLGTASDNQKDCWNKGRRNPVDNHGEKHGMAVLTEEQVLSIRAEYIPRKIGYSRLAKKYGVAMSTVQAIINRRNWSHI